MRKRAFHSFSVTVQNSINPMERKVKHLKKKFIHLSSEPTIYREQSSQIGNNTYIYLLNHYL